ncbi:MAG: DUF5020 family protein [Bacteroidales bacterium]|nr:DUF5020 family protein [Bacteroidales bacterium]
MFKKTILAAAVAAFAFGQAAKAQTNLQVFYDFAQDRQHVTTTVEGFYGDKWGNTFFFLDHDFGSKNSNNKVYAPSGTYLEIARCLNFWQNVPVLNNFSLQVEYNGGVYNGYTINNAWLFGVDYFLHSKDFKNTFNFKVLAKLINYNDKVDLYGNKRKSAAPLQFTFVWGMQDLFGVKGLRFSGFADFWFENHAVYNYSTDSSKWGYLYYRDLLSGKDSDFVFISEPQLWYNVGQHFGVDNLNLGGEVELSVNFGDLSGFRARPCLGAKWVF